MATPFPPSDFDGNQVLQHAFDEAKGCLRVCVIDGSPGSGGGIEVIIDHTEDSIRLGNGVDFITSTTIGGKIGYDVNVINSGELQSPAITSLNMPIAGTEYVFVFIAGTKELSFRSRKKSTLQYGWAAGDSGTNYFSLMPGNIKEIKKINPGLVVTLYIRSTKATDTLEIEYWL